MGFAYYGRQGRGLSDRAQHRYNVKRVAKYRRALGRYPSLSEERKDVLAGRFAGAVGTYRGHPEGGVRIRGVYQNVVGGSTATNTVTKSKDIQSQFGSHTTGYTKNRRYPSWVMQMLGKGSALGKPPGKDGVGSLVTLGGLTYVVLKVLV